MGESEEEFIFGQRKDYSLEKLMFSASCDEYYSAEEALLELEALNRDQGIALPEDYPVFKERIAKLAIPALISQANVLYASGNYALASATIDHLGKYCQQLEQSLPEEAELIAKRITDSGFKPDDIPERYRGDKIIAFVRMPDKTHQHLVSLSPARIFSVITYHATRGIYLNSIAGVNSKFITRAHDFVTRILGREIDKIEISDIIKE